MIGIIWLCVRGCGGAIAQTGRACLSKGPLLALLGLHYLLYRQGKKAAQRAQKYMTWKVVSDLDEDSLRQLLNSLPAWIKCDEFERARFINQALTGMWEYLDTTICSAIKDLEPALQNLPFPLFITFEKLGFGDAPFQIRGVKHASLYSGPGEPMALCVEVEAAWVTQPDIVVKLMPKRWALSHIDMRPAMYVRVDHMAIEGRLRLVFPLQLSLPIFNGMSISFLSAPHIDHSLKMLGGVDVMSMPALQEWATSFIREQISKLMTFPQSIDISFIGDEVHEYAAQHNWPSGIATLDVKTVHLPKWQTQACMPSVELKPVKRMGKAFEHDVHSMTYPLVMDPQRPETLEPWQASFPVFDPAQVLEFSIQENREGNKPYPVTYMRIPLGPMFTSTGRPAQDLAQGGSFPGGLGYGDSAVPPELDLSGNGIASVMSGPVPTTTRPGFKRAQSESQLPNMAGMRSASSDMEEQQSAAGPECPVEAMFWQSTPATPPPPRRRSFATASDARMALNRGNSKSGLREHPHLSPPAMPQPNHGSGVGSEAVQEHHAKSPSRKRTRLNEQPPASSASQAATTPAATSSKRRGRQADSRSDKACTSQPQQNSQAAQSQPQNGQEPKRAARGGFAGLFRRRPPAAPPPKPAASGASSSPATVTQATPSTNADSSTPQGPQPPASAAAPGLLSHTPSSAPESTTASPREGSGGDGRSHSRRPSVGAVHVATGFDAAGGSGVRPARPGASGAHASVPGFPATVVPRVVDSGGWSGVSSAWSTPRSSSSGTHMHAGPSHTHGPHAQPRGPGALAAQWSQDPALDGPPRCATCHDLLEDAGQAHHAQHAHHAQRVGVGLHGALAAQREGSAVLMGRRPSSAASESPSFREWSGGGAATRQCGVCARRAASGLSHHHPLTSMSRAHTSVLEDDDEEWGPWSPEVPMPGSVFVAGSQQPLPTSSHASGFIPPRLGDSRTASPALSRSNLATNCPAEPLTYASGTSAAPVSQMPALASPSHQSDAGPNSGSGLGRSQPPHAALGATATSLSDPAGMAYKFDTASAELDFDELWAGPASVWDVAAMRRSLVAPASLPTSPPPTLPSPSTDHSHLSTKPSQDRLSDLVQGTSLDTEASRGGSSRASPAVAAENPEDEGPARGSAAGVGGPPLVARSKAAHLKCEVPIWLPDVYGTIAAMGPGGAYIMMQPLRQRSWIKHLEFHWQTDILHLLPQTTVLEIKRNAAAILQLESECAFAGPHPLIRSYNMHAAVNGYGGPGRPVPYRRGRPGSSLVSQGLARAMSQSRRSFVSGVFSTLAAIASSPLTLVGSSQRPALGRSHPTDIHNDAPRVSSSSVKNDSSLKAQDVQLEANASTGSHHFRGFAGTIKAQLQWMPLQWMFLVSGETKPAPPLARFQRGGVWLTSGVLVVRLLRTTVFDTRMKRPEVILQLDHIGGKPERRRTGVRERWAHKKESLHHGTVEWELKFSFCVDIEDPDILRLGTAMSQRCLQIEVLEVAQDTSWDRMRAYWAADGLETFVGAARVPLVKVVGTPNKPYQAVWQLVSEPVLSGREPLEDVKAKGSVTLETAWLPACCAS